MRTARARFSRACVIPANRLSKVAQNILNYVPLPNTPSDGTSNATNNFVPDSNRQNKMADVLIRGDHSWNNNHKSFATVRWYHEDELAGDDFHNAFTGAYQHRMTRGSGIDHVWTLSPTKILDLKMNLTRYEEPNNDHGVGFDPVHARVPGVLHFAPVRSGRAAHHRPLRRHRHQPGRQRRRTRATTPGPPSLTHVTGNMTWKYGAEFWVLQQANKDIGNQGRFDFGNEWTRQQAIVGGGTGVGSTLGSFLLGLPTTQRQLSRCNADEFWSPALRRLLRPERLARHPQADHQPGTALGFRNAGHRALQPHDLRLRPDRRKPDQRRGPGGVRQASSSDPKNAANAGVQILQQLLPASAFKVHGRAALQRRQRRIRAASTTPTRRSSSRASASPTGSDPTP